MIHNAICLADGCQREVVPGGVSITTDNETHLFCGASCAVSWARNNPGHFNERPLRCDTCTSRVHTRTGFVTVARDNSHVRWFCSHTCRANAKPMQSTAELTGRCILEKDPTHQACHKRLVELGHRLVAGGDGQVSTPTALAMAMETLRKHIESALAPGRFIDEMDSEHVAECRHGMLELGRALGALAAKELGMPAPISKVDEPCT